MSIQYGKLGQRPLLIIDGNGSIEEAEEILIWMDKKKPGQRLVDLENCHHLHAAVLDVLIEKNARIHVKPQDPFLATLLQTLGLLKSEG